MPLKYTTSRCWPASSSRTSKYGLIRRVRTARCEHEAPAARNVSGAVFGNIA